MLLWLLMLQLKTVLGEETCRNYPTQVVPTMFREGDWFDQVRVYSGSHDYVSEFHPSETVSLFMAKYYTNCGYFELKIPQGNAIDLYKGYYVPRFREHFYPFKARIERNIDELKCEMYLERSQCEHFGHLNETVRYVNILFTDYTSYIILHQCINGRNYLMLLTRNKRLLLTEKNGIEATMIDVMNKYGIELESPMFSWAETNFCDMLLGFTYPPFYSKNYIDRNQTRCPDNLPFKMTDLKHYWKNRTEDAEKRKNLRKTITICVIVMVFGFAVICGLVWINLDNINI
jgi:hypothetical protein